MPLTHFSLRLLALPGVACFALLTGCATNNPCAGNMEYLAASDRPQLVLPEGVTGSERLGGGTAMTIPPAAPDAAKLDPAPKCLDQPPPYAPPKKKAMSGSAEEAVQVWASAWANGKADQVAAFYSPQFTTATEGGSTAYIADLKQQVASGPTPDARLEGLKSTDAGSGRQVVTFVQHFGNKSLQKELTLEQDAQGWRIVAERTLP
jgi:hypothetical protein